MCPGKHFEKKSWEYNEKKLQQYRASVPEGVVDGKFEWNFSTLSCEMSQILAFQRPDNIFAVFIRIFETIVLYTCVLLSRIHFNPMVAFIQYSI
jgi:hypothetical protein